MKFVVVLFIAHVVAVYSATTYTTRFDNIDIDKILASKRVLSNYIKCILDAGPCTAEGREFRKHIPEAIADNCAKCTEQQKKIIKKTSNYIMQNRPDDWVKIKDKFDPQEKYKKSFEQFLKSE